MKSKKILAYYDLVIPLALIGALSLIALSQYRPEWLSGTDDGLFYFWRYGAFSLIGLICGIVACLLISLYISRREREYKRWQKWIVIIPSALIFLPQICIQAEHYFSSNILSVWLAPEEYADTNGWLAIQISKLVDNAQFFGSTDASCVASHLDNNFPAYLLGSLGWFAFIVMLLAFIALFTVMLIRIIRTKPSIHKYIAVVIFIYIVGNAVWNGLEAFNLLPFSQSHMPFISYNRVTLILDLFLFGVFTGCTDKKVRQTELG